MATVQDRDIANEYVAAKFKTYRFVAPTGLNRVAGVRITKGSASGIRRSIAECVVLLLRARLSATAHQTLAPDPTGTKNRNVFEVLAPDHTVVPVAVAKVLILIPLIRFRRIILAVFVCRISGEYCSALVHVQRDVALQMNRETAISACGKVHCAATC